jgi:hypothetical protein
MPAGNRIGQTLLDGALALVLARVRVLVLYVPGHRR